jgi:hypothetical protein
MLRLSVFRAVVDASNKIRLGNTQVTVIEGQVSFTASSNKTKKENFKPVDVEKGVFELVVNGKMEI